MVDVTVVQYPSIYAEADESNGYAYVNSYTRASNRGGRYQTYREGSAWRPGAWNSRGNDYTGSDRIGNINTGNAANSNYNQYVVTVSVLPEGYRVAGMTEEVVIGDPRGGRLADNFLGYNAGTNGSRNLTVQANYDGVSSSTQNVIAPAIRVASSWGATSPILNYDRAVERCASYQENGYPAGRWRVPTVAEIDFLIRLSDYQHIPELFSPEYYNNNNPTYYAVYWAGGNYVYGGVPYTSQNHSNAFIDMSGATYTNQNSLLQKNNERFSTYMRCVYDEWYWTSSKYNNAGQQITETGTAATQWLGYIY